MLENLNKQQREEAAAECWNRFEAEVDNVFMGKVQGAYDTKEQMLEAINDIIAKYEDEMSDYKSDFEVSQMPFTEAVEYLNRDLLADASVQWLEQRNTSNDNAPAKYSVYYYNNVECNKVAEFATLDEAKAYCAENTKDYDEVCAGDNSYEGRSNNFRYEVYEGDSYAIFDEDGEVTSLKDSIYETKSFYSE